MKNRRRDRRRRDWRFQRGASAAPGRAGGVDYRSGAVFRRLWPLAIWLNSAGERAREYHALRMAGIDRYRTLFAQHPDLPWLRFDGGLYWAADDDRGTHARHARKARTATIRSWSARKPSAAARAISRRRRWPTRRFSTPAKAGSACRT